MPWTSQLRVRFRLGRAYNVPKCCVREIKTSCDLKVLRCSVVASRLVNNRREPRGVQSASFTQAPPIVSRASRTNNLEWMHFRLISETAFEGFKLLQSSSARAAHNHISNYAYPAPCTRRIHIVRGTTLSYDELRRARKKRAPLYNVTSCNKTTTLLLLSAWAGEHHVYRVQLYTKRLQDASHFLCLFCAFCITFRTYYDKFCFCDLLLKKKKKKEVIVRDQKVLVVLRLPRCAKCQTETSAKEYVP